MANYYDEQILGARQQAETARKLREMALQENPQGQMVSGHYVAPSWTQGLATGLRALAAAQKESAADESIKDLQRQRAQATIQAMNQAGIQAPESLTLQAGTPEQSPGFLSRVSAFLRGEEQPQTIPAKAYQQNVAQNVPAEQRDAALMNMYTINPDIGAPLMQHEQWKLQQQQAKDLREQALADKKENREFLAEQRRQEQQARFDQQREMANLTANLSAANRQAPQVYGVENINGVPMRVNKATGQVEPLDIPGMPKQAPKLDVTTEKAILESDELANSSRNVIGMLETAKDLNKKAYSGVGAGLRANIVSNLGGSDAANATVDLDNIMSGQALESLKSTFGGNPTEGERKILLDLQASSSKTPEQRESIINRAIAAAERRAKFHSEKSSALREGTYFSQGMPEQQTSQPSGWAIRPKGQ